MLREVKGLVPATVIFLGDGEFDSPELQAEVAGYEWEYVCRTAKNIQIGVDEAWSSLADLQMTRGQRLFRKGVLFTKAAYGLVMVIAWWGAGYPLNAKTEMAGIFHSIFKPGDLLPDPAAHIRAPRRRAGYRRNCGDCLIAQRTRRSAGCRGH